VRNSLWRARGGNVEEVARAVVEEPALTGFEAAMTRWPEERVRRPWPCSLRAEVSQAPSRARTVRSAEQVDATSAPGRSAVAHPVPLGGTFGSNRFRMAHGTTLRPGCDSCKAHGPTLGPTGGASAEPAKAGRLEAVEHEAHPPSIRSRLAVA